jgi:hypothetical protein
LRFYHLVNGRYQSSPTRPQLAFLFHSNISADNRSDRNITSRHSQDNTQALNLCLNILLLWRWGQQVPPKSWQLSTKLLDVTSHKTVILIVCSIK